STSSAQASQPRSINGPAATLASAQNDEITRFQKLMQTDDSGQTGGTEQQPNVISMIGEVANEAVSHPMSVVKGASTIVKGMAETNMPQTASTNTHPFKM